MKPSGLRGLQKLTVKTKREIRACNEFPPSVSHFVKPKNPSELPAAAQIC